MAVKRDPSDIMVDIVHILNVLTKDQEYSINNISKQSGTHWTTVSKYLQMIDLVQKFSPEIEFTEQKKIIIRRFPSTMHLDKYERLLLYLFERRAFDPESVVSIPQSMAKEAEFLFSKNYIFITADNNVYLLDSGKRIALDLFLETKDKICEKIPISEPDSSVETEPDEIQLLKQQVQLLGQQVQLLTKYTIDATDFIQTEVRAKKTPSAKE